MFRFLRGCEGGGLLGGLNFVRERGDFIIFISISSSYFLKKSGNKSKMTSMLLSGETVDTLEDDSIERIYTFCWKCRLLSR